jgi:hypothetical protein
MAAQADFAIVKSVTRPAPTGYILEHVFGSADARVAHIGTVTGLV